MFSFSGRAARTRVAEFLITGSSKRSPKLWGSEACHIFNRVTFNCRAIELNPLGICAEPFPIKEMTFSLNNGSTLPIGSDNYSS